MSSNEHYRTLIFEVENGLNLYRSLAGAKKRKMVPIVQGHERSAQINGEILGILTELDDDRRKTSGIEIRRASGMITIDSANITMTIARIGISGCGAADGGRGTISSLSSSSVSIVSAILSDTLSARRVIWGRDSTSSNNRA